MPLGAGASCGLWVVQLSVELGGPDAAVLDLLRHVFHPGPLPDLQLSVPQPPLLSSVTCVGISAGGTVSAPSNKDSFDTDQAP